MVFVKGYHTVCHHPSNTDDYESDGVIDEEIEHRLYSMIEHQNHHHAVGGDDELQVVGYKDGQQSPHRDFIVDRNPVSGGSFISKRDDSITNSKRRKKDQPVSPPKRVKKSSKTLISTEIPTASSSSFSSHTTASAAAGSSPLILNTINSNEKKQTPQVIYLSDSDEDTLPSEADGTFKGHNGNLWHIDYKDFLISNPIHGKFHRPKIWCSRCRKEGNHTVKLCPFSKDKICYICGGIGHVGAHCSSHHCRRCMDFHSIHYQCSLNARETKCKICCKYGHRDDVCPNHWRKFHNITDPRVDPESTNAVKDPRTNSSCSWCGFREHYSFECNQLRSRSIEISSPLDMNTSFCGVFYHQTYTQPTRQSFPHPFNNNYTTPKLSRQPRQYNRTPSRYYTFDTTPDHSNLNVNYLDNKNSRLHNNYPTTSSSYQPAMTYEPPNRSNHYNKDIKTNNNRKKKTKAKKKKRKAKKAQIAANNAIEIKREDDYIRGGSIRSGKVEKSKSKKISKNQGPRDYQHLKELIIRDSRHQIPNGKRVEVKKRLKHMMIECKG